MTFGGNFLFVLLYASCLSISWSQTNLWFPKTYDASLGWNQHCLGYKTILNQSSCSSCCAAAISSTLSARDCMRDGRNVLYSMMQIWDCTSQSASSSCTSGTNLKEMVEALSQYKSYLVNNSCSLYERPYEPDVERCTAVTQKVSINQSCGFSTELVSSVHSNEIFTGRQGLGVDLNGIVAANSLMAEILVNGPVVVVLQVSKHDWSSFINHTTGVFVPTLKTGEHVRHCLMVYGWGRDNQSGLEYWMVQNSFGPRWGYFGKGKIAKNYNWVENEWRGISTKQQSCFTASSVNTSCMPLLVFQQIKTLNQEQLAYDLDSYYYQSVVKAMSKFLTTHNYAFTLPVYVEENRISYLSNGEVAAITFFCSMALIFFIYITAWRFDLLVFSKRVSVTTANEGSNMFTFFDEEAKRSSDKFAKSLLQTQKIQNPFL